MKQIETNILNWPKLMTWENKATYKSEMCIHVSFVFGSRPSGTLSLWRNIVLNHVEYILFKLSGLRSLIWQKSKLFMTTREKKKDNEIEDGNRMWDREQMKGRKSDGRHELEDLNRVIWFKSEFPFSFHSNSFNLFLLLILLPLSLSSSLLPHSLLSELDVMF